MKSAVALLFTLVSLVSLSQITLFSDDFESGVGSWVFTGDIAPNSWLVNTCAGNGTSSLGNNALYISSGGTIPGCGATGTEQYAYTNATLGSFNSAISYTSIDGSCVKAMEMNFDYKIEEDPGLDYAEIVYSTDGGSNWIGISGPLSQSANWTNINTNLPSLLDGTMFLLGFIFHYDDNTIIGNPLAIDNIEVTGIDDSNPNITCPTPINIYVDANCQVSLPDYSGLAIVSDNCPNPLNVIQTPSPGTTLTLGPDLIVSLEVSDLSGNTAICQFSQQVFDTISPVLNCPIDQIEIADNFCDGVLDDYLPIVSGTDNCTASNDLIFTQSPAPGTAITGTTVVTFNAEDEMGNIGACSINVTVDDQTPPMITCPSDITLSTNNGCDYQLADFSIAVSVADNCSSVFTYSQTPAVGTLLPVGVHAIEVFATDDNGNSSSCIFNITVEDQTPPVISACAPVQSTNVDANCEGQIGDYTSLITASDNCSAVGNLIVTQSPVSGTTITSNTQVTITVTDEQGNSEDCLVSVNLVDNTDPTATCPGNQTLTINSSCEYTVPDLSGLVSGTDNCSAFTDMTIIQSPITGATADGVTSVLITLIDEQGNQDQCTTTLVPDDTDAPTITCPSPGPVDLGAGCDYATPNFASGTLVLDNCPNFTLTQSPVTGTILNPGSNNITITVTDAGGNEASCSFILEISETVAPTITCPSNISICDSVVTYSDPTFNDNCFAYLTQTDMTGLSSGSVFPTGITTLDYSVADSSGNMAMCSFDVEVLESPSPAIILEDTLIVCDANSGIISAESISQGTGTWSVVSGGGNFNNPFAPTTGVNNLMDGESVFVWTVTATCGSDDDTLVVITGDAPLPAVIQDDTIYACSFESIALSANAPVIGTGMWSSNSAITFSSPNNFNTNAALSSEGWQMATFTVSSGGCPTTSDSVMIFSSTQAIISNMDTTVCLENDLFIVYGNIPKSDETGSWYFISGFGDITSPNSPSTEVNNFELGTNWLIYEISQPECDNTYDTLIVGANICDGFDPVIPTVITPNFDGVNDQFVIKNLDLVHPDCEVIIFNRWGSVVFESEGYTVPWNGTHDGEPLPMGTYFYKIKLNDSNNTILSGDISIIH
jgi:gliding motility-associated-like protein